MKVVGCQWNLAWENKTANFDAVRRLLENVEDADLIVLPEMFSTGFSMNVAEVTEGEPSETESFLRETARDKNAAILGGLVRRDPDGWGSNESIAFAPSGNELARYRKNRTFRYTRESDHYRNGSEIVVFEYLGWKIAPFICYDLRFPELFRRATSRGAELFIVIANWPTVRAEHWVTLLRARAIENLAWVVGVNRCGSDPHLTYPGRSLVVDPWGQIVADAGDSEAWCGAELDQDALRGWRDEFPALLDLESE